MQKVLLINDYRNGGGAEVVFQELYETLKESFDVRIFTGAENNTTPPKSPGAYISSRSFCKKLYRTLKGFEPDIVHLYNYYHLLTPSILDALKKIKKSNVHMKVIYTAHDFHLLCPNSGMTSFSWAGKAIYKEVPPLGMARLLSRCWDRRGFTFSTLKLLQWLLAYRIKKTHRIFDLITAPSHFLAEMLKTQYPSIPVEVMRNPCPAIQTDPVQVRKRGEDMGETLNLLFAGRLAPEKGIGELLELLQSTSQRPWTLTIVGDGPERRGLEEKSNKFGLSNKVTFRGPIPHKDLQKWMPEFDAFIMNSLLYENAPLSLVEASAAGLALMVPNFGGMKEMAELCGNSYCFNPENTAAFISTLEDLLKRGKGKRTSAVRDRIEKEFSSQQFVTKTLKTYKRLST